MREDQGPSISGQDARFCYFTVATNYRESGLVLCPLRDLAGVFGAGRVCWEAAICKRCSETAVRPPKRRVSTMRPEGDRGDRVIVAVADVLRCRLLVVMVLVSNAHKAAGFVVSPAPLWSGNEGYRA